MVGDTGNDVQGDVKQRTIKVAWDLGTDLNDSDRVKRPYESCRPTEEELVKAFSPFGDIIRVGIKDTCAVVLFKSSHAVLSAAEYSSWQNNYHWKVRPMEATWEDASMMSSVIESKSGGILRLVMAQPANVVSRTDGAADIGRAQEVSAAASISTDNQPYGSVTLSATPHNTERIQVSVAPSSASGCDITLHDSIGHDRSVSELPPDPMSAAASGMASPRIAVISMAEKNKDIQQATIKEPARGGGRGGGVLPGVEQERANTKKAREQSKRLALEVARLRCSLNRTTAEWERERAARVQLEEIQRKGGGSLATVQEEAERVSRLAQAERELLLRSEETARLAKNAADHVAQEATGRKIISGLEGIVKVQDRLIHALQTEMDTVNRARETAKEDARETKEQLSLWMADSLLWRNRAKRVQVALEQPGLPSPTEGRNDKSPSSQSPEADAIIAPVCDGTGKDSAAADGLDSPEARSRDTLKDISAGHQQADGGGGIGEQLPLPERRTKDYLKTTYRAASDFTDPDQCRQFPMSSRGDKKMASPRRGSVQEQGMNTETWGSTGIGFEAASVVSKSYFERSMRAQQEGSARLEKELTKARAELDSLFGHDPKGADPPYPSPSKEKEDDLAGRECGTGKKEEAKNRTKCSSGHESNSASHNHNNIFDGRTSHGKGVQMSLSFPSAPGGGIASDDYDDRSGSHTRPVEIAEDNISFLSRNVEGGAVAGDDRRATHTDAITTTGPYMARVLAALLGREDRVARCTSAHSRNVTRCTDVRNAALTATATTATPGLGGVGVGEKDGGNNAPAGLEPTAAISSPLLSDYPPILQAVFGTDVGILPLVTSPATTTCPMGDNPPVGVITEKSRALVADIEPQPGSSDVDVVEPEGLSVQETSHPTPSDVYIRSGGGSAGVGAEAQTPGGCSMCATGHEAMSTSSVEGTVGAAFRGYEAKSALLKRWLADRT